MNFKGVDICLLHDLLRESVQPGTAQSTREKTLNMCSFEYEVFSCQAVVAKDFDRPSACLETDVNGLTLMVQQQHSQKDVDLRTASLMIVNLPFRAKLQEHCD